MPTTELDAPAIIARLNMKNREIAAALEMDQTSVWYWRVGRRHPRPHNRRKLLKLLAQQQAA